MTDETIFTSHGTGGSTVPVQTVSAWYFVDARHLPDVYIIVKVTRKYINRFGKLLEENDKFTGE